MLTIGNGARSGMFRAEAKRSGVYNGLTWPFVRLLRDRRADRPAFARVPIAPVRLAK
jgi:hypothetical protein